MRGGYNYVGKALRNADGCSDKRADEAQFIGNSIDDDMRGSQGTLGNRKQFTLVSRRKFQRGQKYNPYRQYNRKFRGDTKNSPKPLDPLSAARH